MIGVSFSAVVACVCASLISSSYAFAVPEKYVPTVSEPSIVPVNPIPDSDIMVFVDASDVFGKIENRTLYYSTDDEKSWLLVSMQLYYGTYSNGTYLGIIPPQKVGAEVKYKISFKDDLGYTYEGDVKRFTVNSDTSKPYSQGISVSQDKVDWEQVNVAYWLSDSESGVKNVTAYYTSANDLTHVTRVDMARISGDRIVGTYRGIIGRISENTTLSIHTQTYDYAGNALNENTTYIVKIPEKRVEVGIRILKIDPSTLEAVIEFNVFGSIPHKDAISSLVRVANTDTKGEVINTFEIPLANLTSSTDTRISQVQKVSLIGDAHGFPFDTSYYVNLNMTVPIENVRTQFYDPRYDRISVLNGWSPHVSEQQEKGIRIDLNRNNITFGEIGFVITFIFFPLGAVLLLANDRDDLTNRLALYLGVFAFVFVFTPIIDEVRPLTYGAITIADFSIIIAIFATLSYMVSSVIGYVYKSRWFDVIALAIPIVFVVFFITRYELNFPWWFIPTIVIGLGFGVAARLFMRLSSAPKSVQPVH